MSWGGTSPGSSSSASWRSSPSPPPSEFSSPGPVLLSSSSESGIGMDFMEELPKKKKVRILYLFRLLISTDFLILHEKREAKATLHLR